MKIKDNESIKIIINNLKKYKVYFIENFCMNMKFIVIIYIDKNRNLKNKLIL